MESSDLWEPLAQYGLAGIFAAIIGWVLYRVGLRMIAAIDRLVDKIDAHTTVDVEHHNAVQQEIIGLRSRIDTALELTPVEGLPRRTTPARGVPSGEYGPFTRPKTRGGG
jgi:hypothetical protein